MKYFATKISENLHKTPEGYLLCLGVPIGRTGMMEYLSSDFDEEDHDYPKDTIIEITRDAKELFSEETIASFEGKPLTVGHPEEFVNSENWKFLAKGTIQNVRPDSDSSPKDLLADILITDADTILLVEDGLRELSCGYEADFVQTGEVTGIQKKIRGNHLALVENGRAGDAYRIKDSKGVIRMSKKLGEKIKSSLMKAIDEAMEPEKKTDDAGMYDELVKKMDEVMKKVDSLSEKKEDAEEPKENEDASPGEEQLSVEDRLKKLEELVSKLLEREAAEEEVPVEDKEEGEKEESKDEEEEVGDEEESEDEDEEGGHKVVGDAAISRAEILAPGIKKSKDIKSEALKQCYKTKEGKKVIDALSGGKPDFKDQSKVDMLFIAASEVIKKQRGNELAGTKIGDFRSTIFLGKDEMTAEKVNELNAKYYKNK